VPTAKRRLLAVDATAVSKRLWQLAAVAISAELVDYAKSANIVLSAARKESRQRRQVRVCADSTVERLGSIRSNLIQPKSAYHRLWCQRQHELATRVVGELKTIASELIQHK